MARSMTGYGRSEETMNGRLITIEVKSVNSRYFEYSARVPRNCGFAEDPLKKAVAACVTRGKVELSLTLQDLAQSETSVAPNLAVAKNYLEALETLSRELAVPNDVKVSTLTRFSDVFTVVRSEVDADALGADVLAVAQTALERYTTMREAEGARLVQDINERLARIEEMVGAVEAGSAERVQRHTEKLYERLQELLGDRNIDDGRVLTEAAIFADKTAVDEETVRLRSHLAQYGEILAADGPVGRKLDFLTQELNRETNTIGSKCQELEITRIVVEMKAEIEKIREQIQNLE